MTDIQTLAEEFKQARLERDRATDRLHETRKAYHAALVEAKIAEVEAAGVVICKTVVRVMRPHTYRPGKMIDEGLFFIVGAEVSRWTDDAAVLKFAKVTKSGAPSKATSSLYGGGFVWEIVPA